jgi:hypothetical protein
LGSKSSVLHIIAENNRQKLIAQKAKKPQQVGIYFHCLAVAFIAF